MKRKILSFTSLSCTIIKDRVEKERKEVTESWNAICFWMNDK